MVANGGGMVTNGYAMNASVSQHCQELYFALMKFPGKFRTEKHSAVSDSHQGPVS